MLLQKISRMEQYVRVLETHRKFTINSSSSQRATATSIVISGFGLSAFLFSVIAHAAFAEDVSSFLLLLSLGTSLPMIVGFFFIRIIPLPGSEHTHDPERRDAVSPASVFLHEHDSEAPLLAHDAFHAHLEEAEVLTGDNSSEYHTSQNRESLVLSPTRDGASNIDGHHRLSESQRLGSAVDDTLPNIHGKALLVTGRFWTLCIILSLCASPRYIAVL
jgi:hypothetical protein